MIDATAIISASAIIEKGAVIGDHNLIQQNVTIHRDTLQGSGITYIGNDNNLMSHVHIGHDCIVGSHCLFASNVGLAGHVEVDDFAIISAGSAVHQFCVIGTYVLINTGACVVQDIPPYVIAEGNRAVPVGIKETGVETDWINSGDRRAVIEAYRLIYYTGKLVADVNNEIALLAKEWQILLAYKPFFSRSARGIIR